MSVRTSFGRRLRVVVNQLDVVHAIKVADEKATGLNGHETVLAWYVYAVHNVPRVSDSD